MSVLFAALGRFSVRFRYLIVIVWILATVFSVHFFPSLASVAKSITSPSAFLPSSAPSLRAAQLAVPFQNSAQAAATIVVTRSDRRPLTPGDQQLITRVEAQVRALPHVTLVRDLGTSRDRDAREALLQAAVPPSRGGNSQDQAFVTKVRHLLTASDRQGLAFHLTGDLPSTVDNQAASNSARNSTQRLSVLFIVVLLLLAFRAVLAPVLTLLPAALVLVLSGVVITGATRIGVQVSDLTQLLLIVLVLGAGTDYGLFLVFRVREELRRGLEKSAAVERAVRTVGESITFSAFTVIAALLSLGLAEFALYQSLGPSLAIGIALMLLAGLTLTPALLAILGPAAFWPSKVIPVAVQPTGLWGRVAQAVTQRPLLTAVLGAVAFGVLALGTLTAGTTGLAAASPPTGSDSAAGAAVIARHFPGAGTAPTALLLRFPRPVWDNPSHFAAAESQVTTLPDVTSLYGPLDPVGVSVSVRQLVRLHDALGPASRLPVREPASIHLLPAMYNLYRATGQFISPDGRTIQFAAKLARNNASSPAALGQIPRLRVALATVAHSLGASESGVFGPLALTYDVNQTSQTDLAHILPLVALIIAILLAVVIRSLVAPLYLVASVVLSYLAVMGLTALVFVDIGGERGVSFLLPFLLFVFLMALGSDYNILVMSRIREEAQSLPLGEAVRSAIGITGSTVTTAGLILGGTFVVLALSAGSGAESDQVRQVGSGVAAGVLLDTFIVRSLLVPSIVVLLGHWNWWPSSLFSRELAPRRHQAEVAGPDSVTEG